MLAKKLKISGPLLNKVATVINTDGIHYKRSHYMQPYQTDTITVSKDEWGTQASSQRMHCMYCSMPQVTSWAKAMPNNEKN